MSSRGRYLLTIATTTFKITTTTIAAITITVPGYPRGGSVDQGQETPLPVHFPFYLKQNIIQNNKKKYCDIIIDGQIDRQTI